MYWESLPFELPGLPEDLKWYVFANTAAPSPEDSWNPGAEPLLENQHSFLVGEHSVAILVGK